LLLYSPLIACGQHHSALAEDHRAGMYLAAGEQKKNDEIDTISSFFMAWVLSFDKTSSAVNPWWTKNY
jgi:hypothetical protein